MLTELDQLQSTIWEFPRGPEHSTLNSRILIVRTPKQGTPNFRKLPCGCKARASTSTLILSREASFSAALSTLTDMLLGLEGLGFKV